MTKTKDVQGLIFIDKDGEMCVAETIVTARVTKDSSGATLSLAEESIGLMLVVPMEPLERMVEVVDE